MPKRTPSSRCRPPVWVALLLLSAACDGEPSSHGVVCHNDRVCGAEVCSVEPATTPEDLAVFALRCGATTGAGRLGQACERGADCARGLCALAGACVVPCEHDADCANEHECRELYARASTTTLGRVRACVARANLPSDAQLHSEVRKDALSGSTDRVALPPSAAGTLYILQHLSDDSWPIPSATSTCRPPLCARSLRSNDPAAVPLFDSELLASLADGPDNAIASGNHVDPLTLMIPNGPRATLDPTGYVLEVETKHAGALRLTTVTRTERGQQLDLNLYYVGAQGLHAGEPRGSELLGAALEEVDRVLGQADIFIGEVRQIEVHGALLERGADLPGAEVSRGLTRLVSQYQVLPQLPELFKLSAGAGNLAINVFFVADIDSRGGGDVGGIAGATPLPLGMHGTAGSGIAIASDMLTATGDAAQLGRILAHELGHALGLFHTTEVNGIVFDPLPDTPVCPKARDLDRNGLLSAHECAADGGDNLMFPTSDTRDVVLTPQQIDVLRAAVILH